MAGICEDDDELRSVLRDALERDGFEVRVTASGAEATRMFAADPPDVLILDVGLPDADGRDVCMALRGQGIESPILFLTARGALTDRLTGFEAGGDDYLAKPFALAEVLLRVHALLRRGAGLAGQSDRALLDHGAHAIVHGSAAVPLTPTEFRLLGALAAQPGRLVRRGTLVAAGWPEGAEVQENTLDAYVARMRRKLREAGATEQIETERGRGYRLR